MRVNLSLRARLLVGAVLVVALSLVLSGVLTGVFVQRLEHDQASTQLEKAAISARRVARLRNLGELGPDPGGNRVLELSPAGTVTYDSEGDPAADGQVDLSAPHLNGGVLVRDGTVDLGGQPYLLAAVSIGPARLLAVARPSSAVSAAATGTLVLRLLLAGAIALAVALLLAIALARNVSVPLHELAGAAEDVAGGNYGRRVSVRGPAEVGVLALAFNRMAEAVERARGQQRDFLANVSHELKTPLTSLIGFSQALVDGSLETDAERTRAATILHEESRRLLRLAQELLELARFESGAVPIRWEAVDLGALLGQEVELVRARARERGLDVQLAVTPGLPPVWADPERVHQVVDNLLDNAVKYAAPDSTVRVVAAGAGAGVECTIWNATGQPAPDPERIFDRFYRAGASGPAAAGAAGVGLGLAIGRELAEAMRGSLEAELREGGIALRLRLAALNPAAGV